MTQCQNRSCCMLKQQLYEQNDQLNLLNRNLVEKNQQLELQVIEIKARYQIQSKKQEFQILNKVKECFASNIEDVKENIQRSNDVNKVNTDDINNDTVNTDDIHTANESNEDRSNGTADATTNESIANKQTIGNSALDGNTDSLQQSETDNIYNSVEKSDDNASGNLDFDNSNVSEDRNDPMFRFSSEDIDRFKEKATKRCSVKLLNNATPISVNSGMKRSLSTETDTGVNNSKNKSHRIRKSKKLSADRIDLLGLSKIEVTRCKFCYEFFGDQRKYNEHEKKDHPVKCPDKKCNQKFTLKSNCLRHVVLDHSNQFPKSAKQLFKCQICFDMIENKSWINHGRSDHNLPCPHPGCELVFSTDIRRAQHYIPTHLLKL